MPKIRPFVSFDSKSGTFYDCFKLQSKNITPLTREYTSFWDVALLWEVDQIIYQYKQSAAYNLINC